VLGVARLADAQVVAKALAGLGGTAFVVHGLNGWDEATPVSPFHCLHVVDGDVIESVRDPLDSAIQRCSARDLRGDGALSNAARLADALAGGDTRAHRDALCLGAALALEVTSVVSTLAEGLDCAREVIAEGRAAETLGALQEVADVH
jgi:anthranilate phosphoribosyltransferase